jgi:fructose-1,6-bisphosphatase/inositol monophosphatase family enzyme
VSAPGIPDPVQLRDLAVAVAREAGELLASRAGRVEIAATKSSPTDVVTEMDRRAEELIRSRLLAARPDDAVLGEEEGEIGGADGARVRWVVDPLDGTVNYLYGLPDWAVSIAAEADWAPGGDAGRAGGESDGAPGGDVGRKILAGAVYVPMRGELFSAAFGCGAWLESPWPAPGSLTPGPGEPDDPTAPDVRATPPSGISQSGGLVRTRLRCRPGVPLGQALVGTGFGYLMARREVQGAVVGALLPQVRDIRRSGVASVDLCAVAAGRLDGYYERGLNYWDWAAGALVASESGAVVGGLHGAPASSSMTVAAGPELFRPLSDALTALDPERDG